MLARVSAFVYEKSYTSQPMVDDARDMCDFSYTRLMLARIIAFVYEISYTS
jgi:hypothetical protein